MSSDVNLAYDLSGCDTSRGAISIDACKAKCASSHSGTVSVKCDRDGGTFTITGCKENTCKLPDSVVKFKALHCDGFVKPSDCAVTCAPGYNSKDNSIFKIFI